MSKVKTNYGFRKIISILTLAALTAAVFVSCTPSYKTVKRMQRMEENVGNPTTKEEYEEAIKKYEKRALDLSTAEAQTGIWYKILGTRYLDQQLYGKAFENFQKALAYYPDNANLYYYVGICAGYLANASLDFEAKGSASESFQKKQNYLRLAENAYLQALSINPKYYRSMYAIGVLYAFELNEPEKAIPHLERFLATQTKDINGMFVLARAYYMDYQFDKAVALYDRIIELKPNEEKVREAQANKKTVLDVQYSQK